MKDGINLKEKYADSYQSFEAIMQAQSKGNMQEANALLDKLDSFERTQFSFFAKDYHKAYPPITSSYSNTAAKPFNEKEFYASQTKLQYGKDNKGRCHIS